MIAGRIIKKIATKLPYLRQPFLEIDQLRAELAAYKTDQFVPAGHFYSPIPSIEQISLNEARIFGSPERKLPAIELNEEQQILLLSQFKPYYGEQPFQAKKKQGVRYFAENPNFPYSDAIFLYCMIRHIRPKKIIEVGSGYSSAVILDTNELFLNNAVSCSFIEPYPQLLLSLISDTDKARIKIIPNNLQDVPLTLFEQLSAGDILFIDSTHVSKVDSDVNYIFFNILPKLKNGVYVHFHDIFYPFEYPREWIYEGRAWNEAYLLRAFLEYNQAYRIVFFNDFLELFHKHRKKLAAQMPLITKHRGGSIWLKKELIE